MKKIVFIVICFFYLINVKADVVINLDCPMDEQDINKSVICDLKINNDIPISNISFDYETSASIEFTKNNNQVMVNQNNVSVTYDSPLDIGNNLILKIIFNNPDAVDSSILLKNINVNNDLILSNISKNITFNKNDALSSNNRVTDITIDGKSIDNFKSDINYYENIVVNKPVVFIDTKGQDNKATIEGVGSVFLRVGRPNKVNVTVTSEDGKTNIYTLVITYVKEDIKSTDASINMIELYDNEKKLDFTFDKEKSNFTIKIDSDIEKVLVKAVLSNDKASFLEGYEPKEYNIDYGDNIVELRTKSENGDTKIYIIHIERDDKRSSDNTLNELIINGIKVNLEDNRYDYEVNVQDEDLETNVYAKANNNKAQVVYKNINIYEGNNDFFIKVIAENGKEKEYHVNVVRNNKNNNNLYINNEENKDVLLKNITVEGYNLNFNKDVYEYDLTINETDNSLNFKVEPEDADVSILNNKNLNDNSTIIVRINENGENKSYTINIHKIVNNNSSNNAYFIYIIALFLIILTIIFILIKKKKK